jgi:peptidoglycan/xylan/chitin deacetylase (PgdA/CDA1 family)
MHSIIKLRYRGFGKMALLSAVAVGLGLTAIFLVQPRWLVDSFASRAPDVLYYVETEALVVALTIDDGPDRQTTQEILDVLAVYDAGATFFLIGERIEGNEDLVRQILRAGHELGNHMTRDEPSIRLSLDEFEENLLEADSVLSRFAQPGWLRTGSGWYNRPMLARARSHGYRVALGSIYPYDAQIPLSWFAASHIRRKLRPGSIIILHDGGGRGRRTAATLRTILPELGRRGYRVVTLSELVRSTANPASPGPGGAARSIRELKPLR